jgi:hypothetical protein
MIRFAVALFALASPCAAKGSFICVELERVSLAEEGAMRPVFEGRQVNFTWTEDGFSGDGVFYHDSYEISSFGVDGFRAVAQDGDRSDVFQFNEGILMHAAIVNYGPEPSIQSQVFRCETGS